jgi:hypothetical protein
MIYCVFPLLFFHFCLEKTNSLQTHMFLDFSVFVCSFLFIIYCAFLGKGE